MSLKGAGFGHARQSSTFNGLKQVKSSVPYVVDNVAVEFMEEQLINASG